MAGYLLNDDDVRTLQRVTERVLRDQTDGRANYHREEVRKSGGSLEVCVLTVAPNGGAGTCAVSKITVASDGTWTATGETSTKIALELA